jgi:hypothetical protein
VLTINGQQFTEYPAAGTGSRPVPSIIATGQIVGGHQTSIVGAPCENANFHSDTTSTAGRGLGILCAYDGRSAGVGRVVTDSSFHHYLDINLIGDPCGASPDRQQGFGPGYAPPAAGSVLADLQALYVNTAEWLSRQKFQFSSAPPFGIGKNQVTATLSGSTPGILINAFSVAVTGFSAADFDPSLSAFAGVTAVSPVQVAITASLAGLRAYAEVDLVLDRQSGPPRTG